jgi:AcrR family transcriptional regulator
MVNVHSSTAVPSRSGPPEPGTVISVTATTTSEPTDGRHARRQRGRQAVIDAALDLIVSGGGPPTAESIATRAGVSVSSVFRYFDALDDLQQEAITRFFARYRHLFDIPSMGVGALEDRITRFVDARLTLHDTVAPVARLARARSLEHRVLADSVSAMREVHAAQVRQHFPGHDVDVTDAIATLTSFECWDILHRDSGRSRREIRRVWIGAITALTRASDGRSAVPMN